MTRRIWNSCSADESLDAGRASPERLMLSTEVQERVSRAMAALSQMERAAFVLRHFEGQSIDEISRALGLKANATKHSIFRAVQKMRVALEPFVSTDEGTSRNRTSPETGSSKR